MLTVAFYTLTSLLTSQGISLSSLSSHGRTLQRALFTRQVTKFSRFQSNVEKVQLLRLYREVFHNMKQLLRLPFFFFSLPHRTSQFKKKKK